MALLLFCVPASAQSYTIIDLGTLGGDRSFVTIPQAAGINNRGQVAGSSFTAGDAAEHAFLYSNGSMMDLGTFLGGNISRAFGVNNAGQVVGFSSGAGFQTHAFLYSNGSMMDLGALGGRKSAIAWAINDAGQITGGSGVDPAVPVEYFHAFLYTNGSMMDLGTLGGPESQGYAINNRGQVTGSSFMASNALTYHAFLSINGSMMDLGTLGGTKSQGFGINNAGQVVGSSLTADDVAEHAFLYSNGSMMDLGTLGGTDSFASGINNVGQVVGAYLTPSGEHAFLYSAGNMIDLSTLLPPGSSWYLFYASAINDAGQIAGLGRVPGSGPVHAFLMTPVDNIPPTTLATASPSPNNNGWNKTNVTVSLNATDNRGGSGVGQLQFALSGAQNTGGQTVAADTASVTISAEGTTTLSYFATDNAGNTEQAKTVLVRIDKTSPAATVNLVPVPNANGWDDTNVTASFAGTDNLSGIDSCSAPITFTNEGANQTATGICTDKAGNVSAPAIAKVNIDKTPPITAATPSPGALPRGVPLLTVSATGTVKSTTGTTLGTVAVQCFDTAGLVVKLNAVDNVAGVATLTYAASGPKPVTSTTVNGTSAQPSITAPGLTTLTFAATDSAGNIEKTNSESIIVGLGEDGIGFGCAMPTPNFTPPPHGTLVVNGTVTFFGRSLPFSKTITF